MSNATAMTVPEALKELLDAAESNIQSRRTIARSRLGTLAITLARTVLAQHEVLENTNCRRVEQSGFVAAVCSFPEQGTGPDDLRGPLPRDQWCDRCDALDTTELAERLPSG